MQAKLRRLLLSSALVSLVITLLPTTTGASASPTLTTCISLKSGAQYLSSTGTCNERVYEARIWYERGKAPSGTPGSSLIDLTICTGPTGVRTISRKQSCLSSQIISLYQRSVGVATAPSMLSQIMDPSGFAQLIIKAPQSDGGARITSYLITSNPGGIEKSITPSQISSAQMMGLSPGKLYSFTVQAINAYGRSPASTALAPGLIDITPSAPSISAVRVLSATSVRISFIAPTPNGGSPVTHYIATSSASGISARLNQAGSGDIDITNLINGSAYTFTISAHNGLGSSKPSAASASTLIAIAPMLTAPSAPSISAIYSTSHRSAYLVFSAPVTDGGSPITHYIATSSPSGLTTQIEASERRFIEITNLSPDTSYSFTLTAHNGIGASIPSIASGQIRTSGLATAAAAVAAGSITYAVGSTGPGGGKVFYYNASGFACGPTHSATGSPTGGLCYYLEVAPKGWYTSVATDPLSRWSQDSLDVTGITNESSVINSGSGLGLGYKNSLAIIAAVSAGSSAASIARGYSNNSLSDWYLPTAAELNELCKWANGDVTQPALGTVCANGALNSLVNGFTSEFDFAFNYWSSSENDRDLAWFQFFDTGGQSLSSKSGPRRVRPVRAF